MVRPARFLAPTAAVLLFAASPARPQEAGLDVTIEYIAGGNLYLRAGTEHGVRAGDTVFVYRQRGGAPLGRFVVLSATADRSVVTFAGDPFPVTRGAALHVVVSTSGGATPLGPPSQPRRDAATRITPGPRASGRLSFDVAALQSTTRWLGEEPVEVSRRFVTPTLSLRTAVADLPGGVRLDANLRAAYRYSTPLVVDPAPSVRIYRASVGKRFARAPLQLEAGRFFNAFDPHGRYLDGLLVRVGRERVGAGVTIGFEPVRGNESFSTELPKYSAFANASLGSGRLHYATDLSFHEIRPRDGLVSRSYVGWSQRLVWNRLALSHDMQVDRTTGSGTWTVTRLRVRGSVPLAGPLALSARYAADRPFDPLLADTLPRPRQEQAGVGLTYVRQGALIGVDVTRNEGAVIERSHTYSAFFNLPRTPLAGVGISGSANYVTQSSFQSVQWSAGLSRSIGSLYARAGYLRYVTESTSRRFDSQAADVSLLTPLNRSVRLSLVARTQWGDNLLTQSLAIGLWTSF